MRGWQRARAAARERWGQGVIGFCMTDMQAGHVVARPIDGRHADRCLRLVVEHRARRACTRHGEKATVASCVFRYRAQRAMHEQVMRWPLLLLLLRRRLLAVGDGCEREKEGLAGWRRGPEEGPSQPSPAHPSRPLPTHQHKLQERKGPGTYPRAGWALVGVVVPGTGLGWVCQQQRAKNPCRGTTPR